MSRFQFVDDHCDTVPVKWPCQLLEVSRFGFYRWRASRAARGRADEELAERIRGIHADSDGTGAPRIAAERDAGIERIDTGTAGLTVLLEVIAESGSVPGTHPYRDRNRQESARRGLTHASHCHCGAGHFSPIRLVD